MGDGNSMNFIKSHRKSAPVMLAPGTEPSYGTADFR